MSEAPKEEDQEKGDELLRRLLKTPPKPHEKVGAGRVPDKEADKKPPSKASDQH